MCPFLPIVTHEELHYAETLEVRTTWTGGLTGNIRLPMLVIYGGASIVAPIACMASVGLATEEAFMGPPGKREEIGSQDRELAMPPVPSPPSVPAEPHRLS